MKMMKYGSKILIAIVIIVLLQATALTFLFYNNFRWYSKEYVNKNNEKSINNNTELLEEWVNQKKYVLTMIEEEYSKKYSKEEMYNSMGKLIESFPGKENEFNSFYYSEINGNTIINTDGKVTVEKNSHEEESRFDYSGEVITFTNKLFDTTNNIVGTINAEILMDKIIDTIEIDDSLSDGSIVMTDSFGDIVFSQNIKTDKKYTVNTMEYENFAVLEDELKESFKFVSKDIEDLDLNVHYLLPKSINSKAKLNYTFILATLMAFIGFIILALIVTKYLIKLMKKNVRYLELKFDEINGFYSRDVKDNELKKLAEAFIKLDDFYEKTNEKQKGEIESIKEINESFMKKNKDIENEITYFKGIDKSIQITENMYEYLMNSIDEIIIVISANNEIEYVNNVFEKKIKEEAKNVIGKDIKKFFKEWNTESKGCEFFSKRDFNNLHVSFVNRDKNIEMPSIIDSKRIIRDNEIVSIQLIIKDISEEQKLYSKYINKSRELIIMNEVTKSLTEKVEHIEILQTLSDKIYNLADIKHSKIELFEGNIESSKVESGEIINPLGYDESAISETLEFYNDKNLEIMKTTRLKAINNSCKDLHVYYFPLKSSRKKYGILSVVLDEEINDEKIVLLRSVANIAVSSIEKAILFEKLRNNYKTTVSALVSALEKKASIMVNHTIRVANYAILIGKKLYLTKDELDDLYIAGLLHDIGKIGIEDQFLKKIDYLTKDEYTMYGAHQAVGKKILDPIGFKTGIIEGIYYQEKNYDLSGYPYDESIKEQPLFASIIQVANTIDTMLMGSEFEEKKEKKEILTYIKKESGVLFNPEITLIAEELFKEQEADIERITNI